LFHLLLEFSKVLGKHEVLSTAINWDCRQ